MEEVSEHTPGKTNERASGAAHTAGPTTPMQEIHAERKRQIEVEGWTPKHDDEHDGGEMLIAATIYFQHAARKDTPLQIREDGAPVGWPWDAKWWKPKNDRRCLVIAGALCVAERDRIRRKHQSRTWVRHVEQKLRLIVEALSLLSETRAAIAKATGK